MPLLPIWIGISSNSDRKTILLLDRQTLTWETFQYEWHESYDSSVIGIAKQQTTCACVPSCFCEVFFSGILLLVKPFTENHWIIECMLFSISSENFHVIKYVDDECFIKFYILKIVIRWIKLLNNFRIYPKCLAIERPN